MQMRNFLIWAVVFVLLLALFQLMDRSATVTEPASEAAYSDFLNMVEGGQIGSAVVQGDEIIAVSTTGERVEVRLPPNDNTTVNFLHENRVRVDIEPEQAEGNFFFTLLMTIFPFLLLIGVWIFFMRQMQGGGGGGAMGFGKSKARLLTEHQGRKTFDDVAGVDEAK